MVTTSRPSQDAYDPTGTLTGTDAPNIFANARSLQMFVDVLTPDVATHFGNVASTFFFAQADSTRFAAA
jgi:hypothetical protein